MSMTVRGGDLFVYDTRVWLECLTVRHTVRLLMTTEGHGDEAIRAWRGDACHDVITCQLERP